MNPSAFERIFGFPEASPEAVRSGLRVEGDCLVSAANGASRAFGRLEIPSLDELRGRVNELRPSPRPGTCREVVADARSLHADPANAGALFQVASQFNLLEMCGPDETPEMGVSKYAGDPTQGPACALACFAGTVYRNYFVPLDGQVGQSAGRQVDCLADLGDALGDGGKRFWDMRNGYALATAKGLRDIRGILDSASEEERDRLRGRLRVGIQWDCEVTLPGAGHRVSQVYGSALPVGYSPHPAGDWEPFARLVLEASYEACLCAAVLNARASGNRVAYLTLLGGGVFGNALAWILDAIARAAEIHQAHGLDLRLVSHARPNPGLRGWRGITPRF
jgi:hypothetical protein